MEGDGDSVRTARSGYMIKVGFVYLFTVYDLVANAWGDHNDHRKPGGPLGIMGAQAGAHILNTLVLFLLLFGTYLFQVGLIGELAQRFRHALYIVPVYFVAVAAQAASKVVLVAVQKTPMADLWENDVFYALTVLKYLIALVYYVVIIRTTVGLGNPTLYQKSTWVARYQSHTV